MSGMIFILLLRIFLVSQYLITTCLPILSTVIWVSLECSRKKFQLTPAVPLVQGPEHLKVDETQRSTNSHVKSPKTKASLKLYKISFLKEKDEPNPTAASLKCGRTQASRTTPVLPSDDTIKHVESLPESSE
ncbi:unnamed protein product [Cercopithifilaria johnstoni]|uniref:Uncharacterized protein n=1 Tax=Cercopithifilaria johnstoni TaxID=2874296 RepID=A0A8J2Q923_9BILA|nr:unnamed protein product [Cercopithifilaria johnstoni]